MTGQEIASFYASIGADTKDFSRGLLDVKNDMSALEKTSAALSSAFKVAFAVGVVAVVGFGAAIGKSIGAAADMEQGVADIGAMMSLTDEDTQKLGAHILDLGLDPTLKVTATEASEAIMALGTAGLTTTQIMGGASEATVLLANATGAQFADAANIATDVMGQFNVKAADLDAAINQIAGTTIASKFTIDDYRLAIAQAGGVAGALGVEFDDFNAAIAATSTSFASGSDAGTSFKVFMQRLMPVSDKAAEYMNKVGLSTAGVGSAFFDASGNMKSMEEIAALLQGAFGGLSEAEKDEAASHIFGTDAMRTALALAKGGPAVINQMKAAIGNVDAETLAAKRMDTFKGSMEIARGVIETISISIGNQFLPVLRPLVDTFTILAQKYGPAIVDFFKQVAGALAGWLKPIADALKGTGGLSENLQKIWDTVIGVIGVVQAALVPIGNVIDKFFDWQDVAAAVAAIMGTTLLSALVSVVVALAPVIATFGAVVLAMAALRWAWQTDFASIRTITLDTVQKLSDWFYKESGIWKGTWEATGAYIADRVEYFFKYKIYNLTVGTWSTIREDLKLTWGILKNRAEEWVIHQAAQIKFFANEALGRITNFKDRMLTLWQEWVEPTIKAVRDWYAITDGKIKQWAGNVQNTVRDVRDYIIDKWNGVLDWFHEHIQPMVDRGKAIIQGLWDGIKEKWNALSSWFSGVWGDLTSKFKHFFGIASPSALFADYGEDISLGLAKGISGASGAVYDAMDGLTPGLTSNVSMMGEPAATTGAASSTTRIEELLTILIQELRSKNMTANVTVSGGGGTYGDLINFRAGQRQSA